MTDRLSNMRCYIVGRWMMQEALCTIMTTQEWPPVQGSSDLLNSGLLCLLMCTPHLLLGCFRCHT